MTGGPMNVVRALRYAKDAIRPYDTACDVFATVRTNAAGEQSWTVETDSAALARGRRRIEPICGIASTPSAAATLFVTALARVLDARRRVLTAKGKR